MEIDIKITQLFHQEANMSITMNGGHFGRHFGFLQKRLKYWKCIPWPGKHDDIDQNHSFISSRS